MSAELAGTVSRWATTSVAIPFGADEDEALLQAVDALRGISADEYAAPLQAELGLTDKLMAADRLEAQ